MIYIPRSEVDYRTELIKEINARLPRPYKAHNSKTVSFDKEDPRIKDLKAFKREFDVVIIDEGFVSDSEINPDRIEFAIETKPLGSKFSGISQAEDAFTAFPNLKITYATKFGTELYKRERDNPEIRLKTQSRTLGGKYIQMAEYIALDVKNFKEAKKFREEFSEEKIIATLTDCMVRIQSQMTELPQENESDLATRTLVMWKKYDDDMDASKLEYNVKRAASYIIVDQLLFYNLLQKKTKKYHLPPLEPINGNEDNPKMFSTKYIERAISDTGDYLPIFGIDMFGLLPKSKNVIKAINDVILKIQGLKIEKKKSDFIGKIFHSMIPTEIRKSLAAYYTGSGPAKLLALLAIKKETDKVCDLACGSGTLLVESYHVLYDLYRGKYPDWTDEKIHKKIIETQIYGNDITLFASHLAAMNLASQYLDGELTKINITSIDGLQITPRHSFATIIDFVKFTEVDTVNMDGTIRSIVYPSVDCVIMNPPFSRQKGMHVELLNNLQKTILQWFPEKKDRKKYIDNKMGLHGYFLIHADHMLKKGGRIAMVLPASTFSTDYSSKLLEFLQDNVYAIEYVMEILSKRSAFSEDASFKEYMVIFRKGYLKNSSNTKIVSLLKEFKLEQVNDIFNCLAKNEDSNKMTVKTVKTHDLYNSVKWTTFFGKKGDFSYLDSNKLESYKNNLSDLVINGGYNGAYSDFLMLPNREWSIKRINETTFLLNHITLPEGDAQRSCHIPSKYLVQAIRKSGDANSFTTKPNCYVLNLPYQLPKILLDFQRKYIYWSENQLDAKWKEDKKKGHKRVPIVKRLTKKRNKKGELVIDKTPWFSHAHKNGCNEKKGKLIYCKKGRPMNRRSFSPLAENTVTINHGFGYIVKSKSPRFYASWMNSALFLNSIFSNHRIISLGYYEMMVSDFDSVKFPKYDVFTTDDRKLLIESWESLAGLPDEQVPFLPQQLGADLVIRSKKKKNPQPDQIIHYNPLPERVELDKAWLQAIGVADDKIDECLDTVYSWLISYMKTR